jgi:hypothetical protein
LSFAEIVAVIRDIAVILIALLDIVLLGLLVFIVFQVWRLVKAIRRELPVLSTTVRQTLTTVEGTTDFLGTTVARPAIDVVGFGVAASRFLRILARGRKREEVSR